MGAEPAGSATGLGEAAASWASARRVHSGGWPVRYREAGSGPPVVLVHGLGISADYWYRNGPYIASQGFRCIAPDLPGFGRTDGPPGGLSIPAQAAALADLAEALGLGAAAYIGHSLSCQVVVELAATRPELVRAMVLAAPTGDRRGNRLLRQLWGLLRDAPRESARLTIDVARAYLQAGPLRIWGTWRKGAGHDPFRWLPEVKVPGLVVIGTRDPVVSGDFAAGLAAALSDGRLVYIPGAVHGLISSNPEEFNQAAVDFLKEVGGDREGTED